MSDTRGRRLASLFLLAIVSVVGAQSCTDGPPKRPGGSVQGQVVDSHGRPVTQYPVRIEGADGSIGAVAFTDFSGTFQFFNLPAGKYKLFAQSEGNDPSLLVELGPGEKKSVDLLKLAKETKVEVNPEAARTINAEAVKTINADAAQTLNPEAAKTLNPEAAKVINPEAARTINKEAAATINPEAAKMINPDAAYEINPEAARVLNPERAITLTKAEARTITPEVAMRPPTPLKPAAN